MSSDSFPAASLRIAVLIDADNVSPSYAEKILEEIADHGIATIKRAYGDWTTTQLAGWKKALNHSAIQPVQQFANTVGKNSTDSALIIDAMDLLWMGNVDAFALVSSDSDFTRLATRLRESGKRVLGIGAKKTPASLRNAVDQFIYLEVLSSSAGDGSDTDGGSSAGSGRKSGGRGRGAGKNGSGKATTAGTASLASDETAHEATSEQDRETDDDGVPTINLQSALARAINATSEDDGWATLDRVGQHLSRSHTDFDPRAHGHQKLSTLVAEQPYLVTRTEGKTMEVALKTKSNR